MSKKSKRKISKNKYDLVVGVMDDNDVIPRLFANLTSADGEGIHDEAGNWLPFEDMKDSAIISCYRLTTMFNEDDAGKLSPENVKNLVTRAALIRLEGQSLTDIAEVVGDPLKLHLLSSVYYFRQKVQDHADVTPLVQLAGISLNELEKEAAAHFRDVKMFLQGNHPTANIVHRSDKYESVQAFRRLYGKLANAPREPMAVTTSKPLAPVTGPRNPPTVGLRPGAKLVAGGKTNGKSVLDCMKAAEAYVEAAVREIVAAREVAPPLVRPGLGEVLEKTKEFNAYLKRMGGM